MRYMVVEPKKGLGMALAGFESGDAFTVGIYATREKLETFADVQKFIESYDGSFTKYETKLISVAEFNERVTNGDLQVSKGVSKLCKHLHEHPDLVGSQITFFTFLEDHVSQLALTYYFLAMAKNGFATALT